MGGRRVITHLWLNFSLVKSSFIDKTEFGIFYSEQQPTQPIGRIKVARVPVRYRKTQPFMNWKLTEVKGRILSDLLCSRRRCPPRPILRRRRALPLAERHDTNETFCSIKVHVIKAFSVSHDSHPVLFCYHDSDVAVLAKCLCYCSGTPPHTHTHTFQWKC